MANVHPTKRDRLDHSRVRKYTVRTDDGKGMPAGTVADTVTATEVRASERWVASSHRREPVYRVAKHPVRATRFNADTGEWEPYTALVETREPMQGTRNYSPRPKTSKEVKVAPTARKHVQPKDKPNWNE